MKNRSTKRALALSFVSLLLCVSMFVGTTFAWFTDSVTSAKNQIVAGNLDVELKYATVKDGALSTWESVQGKDDIFDPEALWEPGRVEVVYLEVSNLGTLALKYQLGVNVYNEIAGINVDDEAFKLSDHLVFKVVDLDAKPTVALSREEAITAAGTEKGLKSYNGQTTSLEVGGFDYVALIVYMPETVGNEANYKTGTKAPTIELGVNLYATQFEAESDSFGPDYDEDAWVDGFQVYSADDLQAALNNGEDVVLMNNITADEVVEITDDVNINLNGKTLTANLTVAKDADVVISKGEIITANGNNSAIESVGNLTLSDVTVSSARHAVRVEGGKTIINGGTYIAKGTAGRTQHALNVSDGAEVIVNGGTFVGPRGTASDSGAAVNVQAGSIVTINGGNFSGGKKNTLSAAGTLVVNGGIFDQDPTAYVTENHTIVKNSDGTWTVGMTKSDLKDSIADAVKDALANGKTEVEIDAHGANIGNLYYGLNTSLVPAGTTVTIKNAVTSGSSYGNAVAGTVVFENCVFDNPNGAYSIHFDAGNGNVVFKNCTLTGWCSYGSAIKSVEMYGCTIKHNGIYGQQRFYQPAVMEDCVFESTVTVDAGGNCDLVVNNCTVDDGSYITDVIYVDDCFTSITIDGALLVSSNEELQAAINSGETNVLLNDGVYALRFTNNTNFNLNGMTIKGLGNVNLAISSSEAWYGRVQGSNVTFENIHFTSSVGATGKAIYNDCTFDSWAICASSNKEETTFNNCTINGCLNTSTDFSSGDVFVNNCIIAKAEYSGSMTMNFVDCQIDEIIIWNANTNLTNCKVTKLDKSNVTNATVTIK